MLAVVTAVVNANTHGGTPRALLGGFHPALVVPVMAVLLGTLAMATGLRRRAVAVAESEELEPEVEVEAA